MVDIMEKFHEYNTDDLANIVLNKEVYEKYYNIFKKLYKTNKSNFHKINS